MLLAVDTSTQWIGLALLHDGQILAETIWKTSNHHSVELAPAVDLLLKRSGVVPADLEALGIATGPGSFTSLRVGMAYIKGLALTLRLPVAGVPTLDITAAAIHPAEIPLAAVLQAGRGRLAVGWYLVEDGHWQSSAAAVVMTPEELEQSITHPVLIAGELDAAQRKTLERRWKNARLAEPALCVRRPSYLAQLAEVRWQAGQVEDIVSLAPTYLHINDPIPG